MHPSPSPRSTSAVESLQQNGFVVLKGVIDVGALDRVRAAMIAEVGRIRRPDAPLTEAILEKMLPEERDLVSGNFPRSFKSSSLLRELVDAAPVREAMKALLGTERLYLHMFPSPRHIAPGNGLAAVPRHTDRQYNDHMSTFVTLWVPVDCFTPDRGGVIVHPRTHLNPTMNTSQRTTDGLWFEATGEAASNGQLLVLSPGDALVLHEHLLHESAPNRSNAYRFSIDFRLFGDRATTTKHYYDLQTHTVFEPPNGERHVR